MSPPPRILHVLSQRPGRTGSGTTLNALTRAGAAAGWDQRVVCGVPAGDPARVDALDAQYVWPVEFGTDALPFPVPGMSDVMPYESTVFSTMGQGDLARYREVWRASLARAVEAFRPDVIHAHHVWIVGSLVPEVARGIPSVLHCHATGLRQMQLCPSLADEVRNGCRQHERFAVLHDGHRLALRDTLGVDDTRIHTVGAGYDASEFAPGEHSPSARDVLYVGKISRSKGLEALFLAFEQLVASPSGHGAHLHLVGGGAGAEADELRARFGAAPFATVHGRLENPDLVGWMQRCSVCVLPSYYEGLPLVLVETAACGARLVATALPGTLQLAAHLDPALIHLVDLPPMRTVDEPEPAAVPAFAERLAGALEAAIVAGPAPRPEADAFRELTWDAVGRRVEAIWQSLRDGSDPARQRSARGSSR